MSRQAMPVQTGEAIDYKNESVEKINVGDVVKLGGFCGVAETDIEPGQLGAVAVTKVWEVDSVSSAAFAVGDPLYWDFASKKATKTDTSNTPLGLCVAPKSSGGTKARVKLGVWVK